MTLIVHAYTYFYPSWPPNFASLANKSFQKLSACVFCVCACVCVFICVKEPTCGSDFLCGCWGKYWAKGRKKVPHRRRYGSVVKWCSSLLYSECSNLLGKISLCILGESVFLCFKRRHVSLVPRLRTVSYPCSSWSAASPCWRFPLDAGVPPSPPLYVYWSAWSPRAPVPQVTW